jgi:hypothetical protein
VQSLAAYQGTAPVAQKHTDPPTTLLHISLAIRQARW